MPLSSQGCMKVCGSLFMGPLERCVEVCASFTAGLHVVYLCHRTCGRRVEVYAHFVAGYAI
eukprot:scaffold150715_cov16-Tisochrysis_lutea.AAC.1